MIKFTKILLLGLISGIMLFPTFFGTVTALAENRSGVISASGEGLDKGSLVTGFDFESEQNDGKIADISGNGNSGTVLKADLDFKFGTDEPSAGWGYARWLDATSSKTVVYDVDRASKVFNTEGLYEILYDNVEFFNKLSDFSFSAWVKFADVPYANVNPYTRSAWLFKADRKVFLDSFCGFGFDFGYAGQQTFYTAPAQLNNCLHTSNFALTKSEWFNYTITVEQGIFRLYISGKLTEIVRSGKGSDDAVLKANAGDTPIKYPKGFDVLTIGGGQQTGAQFGGFFRPTNMFLDNVSFYNKALMGDEVETVMAGNLTLEVQQKADTETKDTNIKNGCNASVNGSGLAILIPLLLSLTVLMVIKTKKTVE